MSAEFYSVHPTAVQNAMGGTQLHTPQSILQHTMNHQNINQQNEAQWLRMPQVPPMSMPWSMLSFQQPDLVQFTGERPLQPFIHQKRKLETPDVVDMQPNKQFITEEKMAQHFRSLHISPTHSLQEPGPSTSTASSNHNVLSNKSDFNLLTSLEMDESHSQPRLVISEEIKKLQQEPILPAPLLSKLERPSMALVLWEPRSTHLGFIPTSRDTPTPIPSSSESNNNNDRNSNSNNNNNNNNNESIPNFNEMDVNINDPTLEPMDL